MARGWKKFALPETVGRAELPPVAVETMGSGLDNAANFSLPGKKKFSTSVQFDSERPLATSPQTLAGEEAISVDVAGSYLLTRNIALKAGRSEEHTSELQSLMRISYAVFCLKHKI